mmetsp:Transcript_702/g.2019  ORF Transcript_702/g.2019 Transcript_702/m.2019 type:complete len:401 (-) Transcript_702:52-1254(-)
MHRNPPLARAGFRMFPASMAPSAAPAPTNVWSSSINRMVFVSLEASATTSLNLSSNSPRYFVPATNKAISSVCTRAPFNFLGTSPSAIFWARPSAMAVFPTPASPTRHGFDFRLLNKIWTALAISSLLPTHGSSSPSRANAVRSTPTEANVVSRSSPSPPTPTSEPLAFRASLATASHRASTSTPNFSRADLASDWSSLATAKNRCSGRTSSQAMASLSETARLKQAFDRAVKGNGSSSLRNSSAALSPKDFFTPMVSRIASNVTPNLSKAFFAFSGHCKTPSNTCSVPTSPSFADLVSCWAYMSTLTASASNLSKSMRHVCARCGRRAVGKPWRGAMSPRVAAAQNRSVTPRSILIPSVSRRWRAAVSSPRALCCCSSSGLSSAANSNALAQWLFDHYF